MMLLLLDCGWGAANGQTFTPLWQFGSLSNDADGISPVGLIQASDGDFYGTTGWTNTHHCTVFKITSAGTLTTLWQFGSPSNNPDGYAPNAGLVQGRDGNFYGTTSGGAGNLPFGTAFKITSAGTLTTIWQFGSLANFADGLGPNAPLVQGSDGSFYGTATGGGTNFDGTVFKVTPDGTLTPLWQFGSLPAKADGRLPEAGLVLGMDGDFYGTTPQGGTNNGGTVFRITSAGTLNTIWRFTGGTDGQSPQARLVQGSDGGFYGTTSGGGTHNRGTVFKITSAGTLTPLWQLGSLSNDADGAVSPALVQGSDGNFYGMAVGGTNGFGAIFKITSDGTLTPLWQFGSLPNDADGRISYAALVQGSDGSFYGTTILGGTNGRYGTVFKLTVPLDPPANQISSVSVADTNVVVAIPSVAGETYQLQYSADPAASNWSNIVWACVSNSLGGLLTVTNCVDASSPQGFYRFDITP